MRQSRETVSLVVAVIEGNLAGSTDDVVWGRRSAGWSHLSKPFSLYFLRDVPLSIAERLIDHPRLGGAGFRDDRLAWHVAEQFASQPFYEK